MPSVKWLALALLVGGCGSSNDYSQFCDAYAQALCNKYVACPSVQPQPIAAECAVTISGSVCFCFQNAMAMALETYHPSKVQACVDAVNAAQCSQISSDPESALAPCGLVYGLAADARAACPMMVGPYPDM